MDFRQIAHFTSQNLRSPSGSSYQHVTIILIAIILRKADLMPTSGFKNKKPCTPTATNFILKMPNAQECMPG